MRELTLLLVLANLGFLAWGLWVAPAEKPRAPVASEKSDVPRLVLLSEAPGLAASSASVEHEVNARLVDPDLPESEGVDVPEAAGATEGESLAGVSPLLPDAAPGLPAGVASGPASGSSATVAGTLAMVRDAPAVRCLSLGPFLDLGDAAEAAARLREQGYAPSQRVADSSVWVGNWVYIGPFATRDAAIGAAENLRDRGVTDLYVEPAGELENAVSLGLFSDRDRAETLASEVRKLGVVPQISDRYRAASAYWVDVAVAGDAMLDAADYQRRPGRGVQVEEHLCAGEDPLAETPDPA
jgi:hypothetical protein